MQHSHNDEQYYRVPIDLSVEERPIKRWLVIGSCLAEGFPDFVRGLPDGADGDFILFNNGTILPPSPPRPISDYDCQMVQIAMRSIVPDFAHARLPFDDVEGFTALFEDCAQRIEFLLDQAMVYAKDGALPTFIPNLIVPQQGTLGRIVGRRDLRNFSYFVKQLNERLADQVEARPNCHLIDFDEILRTYGAKYFQDDVLWQYNHAAALTDNDIAGDRERMHVPAPVSEHYTLRTGDYVHAIWEEIKGAYITAKRKGAVKLVIFDIDDTLWRGVVAEQDEPDPGTLEGWPLGVAEAALYLKQRGIVIAIVSKNSEERIRAVWDRMWLGRLHLDDFASIRINWNSKAENVAEIIREVNVLPDSVVFVDDNPVERHTVEAALPGIRTIGADPYYVKRILMWSPETQPVVMTGEAARRNDMIRAQVEREAGRAKMDRSAFIASLDIVFEEIHVTGTDQPRFERVFELLNKTNQFNTTGKRWERDEMARAFESGLEIFAFEVKDRFTSYGLVGMALVRDSVIEQFVMSCRVIGLDVELSSIDKIKARYPALQARYTATEKNFLCADLYQRAGFEPDGDSWAWRR